jgi:hypothetical protein
VFGGKKNRRVRRGSGGGRGGRSWLRALGYGLVGLVLVGVGLLFTAVPGKIKRGLIELVHGPAVAPVERSVDPVVVPEVVERPAEVAPDPEVLVPEPEVPSSSMGTSGGDVRALAKGITLKTRVEVEPGGLASAERSDGESYVAEFLLRVRVPEASKTLGELEKVNGGLGALLPGLVPMMDKAVVSPHFNTLYKDKTERLKRDATQLNELLTKHNMYDCETILNLTHPDGRKVFLLQAEMDVVSDGSDGDRLATMPDEIVKSANYQPFTSYGWKKTGTVANPMSAGWQERVKNANEELERPATTAERKKWLKERIAFLKRGIEDMKYRSFLVAEYDPYIVISINLLTDRSDPFAPKVGDYAVVVHGNKLYPAIVGDGGPTFKVGEASLRLAKEINPAATPYKRPVSDLTVTYLVFPGTAESPKCAPDYAAWRSKCEGLLQEIGGLGEGAELHEWANLFPPPPAPPVPPAPVAPPAPPAPPATPPGN